MSVSYTDHTSSIKSDVTRKSSLALHLMLDGIDKASDPGTPKRLGDLRRNKLKQVLGLHGVIQWRQKYAADQEDKQHKSYTTAGTGPHYAENAARKVVGQADSYFRKAGL